MRGDESDTWLDLTERQLATLLAAYDEELASGVLSPEAQATPATLPPTALPRLERAKACLQLLAQFSNRPSATLPDANAVAAAPTSTTQVLRGDASSSKAPAPILAPAMPKITGYELVEELGRGGMGVVYKAWQPKLKRFIAIKMLPSGVAPGSDFWNRFFREAEAVARLQHPHIVPIYEVGEHEGRPFFSMEYLEGGSLAKRLAGKPIVPQDAARLLEPIAGAVQFAHQRGIVHRDLKPGNILLATAGRQTPATGEGERTTAGSRPPLADCLPKITDFGLAKQIESDVKLTQTGSIVGTVGYMAPEQATAKGEVGPPADVYALGALLYEMLTGRPPFVGATPFDILLQVPHTDPVPPTRLQPKVPADLETICLKCLEKEPRKRYVSAQALADDVRRFLEAKPILARPAGVFERSWKWAKRRPGVAALLAMLLVVSVLGFTGVTWQWLRAEDKAEQEAAARREATRQQEEADKARRDAETSLYFSRITQAEMHWRDNNVMQAEQLLDLCPAHFRGWEWHYLKRLCHADLATLEHRYWVNVAAYSPDGRLLATAAGLPGGGVGDPSKHGELKLWDANSGRPLHTFTGHTGRVGTVVFSPDSRRLVSTAFDGLRVWDTAPGYRQLVAIPGGGSWSIAAATTIAAQKVGDDWRLWDLTRGTAISCPETGAKVLEIALAPDGRRIALRCADDRVRIWEPATKENAAAFPCAAAGLTFSADGQLLAGALPNAPSVQLFDVAKGQLIQALAARDSVGLQLAFSPDGRYLACRNGDSVRVWKLTGDTKAFELRGHNGEIYDLAFAPDSRSLATAGADRTARLWELEQENETSVLRGHTQAIRGLAFSPNGKRLTSASQDGTAKIWDLTRDPRGWHLQRGEGAGEYYADITFSANGRHLLTAKDTHLNRWDLASGQRIVQADLPWRGKYSCPRNDFAFAPAVDLLAAAAGPRTVTVRDLHKLTERFVLEGHTLPVRCVAFSDDGQRIATAAFLAPKEAGGSGKVECQFKVWEALKGREILTFSAEPCFSLALSPNGRTLATGGWDGKVRIFDAETGHELFTAAGHRGFVSRLAFSSDGERLASAGFQDGRVILWNVATGQTVFRDPLQGPPPLTGVSFSPDGKRLAAVGYDGLVALWDTGTGHEVLTLRNFAPRRPNDYAYNARVVFSPDGRRIASNNWDGSVNVWDAGD
jgi:WD40 repeat protein/serine/threonine protein kinase